MRHTESGVASLGHFDNFSCWQFGESSPHKEGLQTMIDEIEYLSREDLEKGHIQVSVFGGYVDKYCPDLREILLTDSLPEWVTLYRTPELC